LAHDCRIVTQINAQPFRIAGIEQVDGSTEGGVFDPFLMRAQRCGRHYETSCH
jgi:hypothetical protein